MSDKKSKYQNEDGTFKEMQGPGDGQASAFGGCVLHMMNHEGHSQESAKRICGAIAANKASAKGGGVVHLKFDDRQPLLEGAVAAARMTGPLNIVPGGRDGTVIIQYMPPGEQVVAPFVNGEPLEMKVSVQPHWADVFQRANESLLANAKAGLDNEPFTDFNHDDDRASSKPQRYYWGGEDPKTGGVLLETRLTASGKAGITKTADTEPDYSSFSPQWIFHKKTLEPLGLPINQGAFVNRAAFKKIGKLPVVSAKETGKAWALGTAAGADPSSQCSDAASCAGLSAAAHKASMKAMTAKEGDEFNAHSAAFQAHQEAMTANEYAGNDAEADQHEDMMNFHKKKANEFAKKALAGSGGPASTTNKNKTEGEHMDEKEFATALAKAFETPAVSGAIKTVVEAATKPLTDKITLLETGQKNEATARAKASVMKHVQRGAIAPEEKIPGSETLVVDFYTEQMIANAAATEMTLSRLPSKGPRRIITGAGNGGNASFAPATPEGALLAKAKDLRQKQPTDFKTDSDALIAVCSSREGSALYQEYMDGVRAGTATGLTKKINTNN